MEVVRIAEELESQGVDVIHLEVGEPDFPTSSSVIERACSALRTGKTRYTDARGIQALRDALSTWYRSKGLDVPAQRIQITVGASAGLLLACAATTNAGDGVLMADPASHKPRLGFHSFLRSEKQKAQLLLDEQEKGLLTSQ